MRTTEDAIRVFRDVHGDRFDYSGFEYKGQHVHGEIICRDHGAFRATFHTHQRREGSCEMCRREARTRVFVERVRSLFGDKFSFERMDYVDNSTPIVLTCKHGDFVVYPLNVGRNKNTGCRYCTGEAKRESQGRKIVGRFRSVHGKKYGYSKFHYQDMHSPGTITCPKHGDFEMSAANHLSNHGCWKCKSNAPSAQENAWVSAIEMEIGEVAVRDASVKTSARGRSMIDAVFGKVAVEYDGSYWHSREGAVEKDERKNDALVKAGYSVIRLRAMSGRNRCSDVSGSINISVPETVSLPHVQKIVSAIRKAQK